MIWGYLHDLGTKLLRQPGVWTFVASGPGAGGAKQKHLASWAKLTYQCGQTHAIDHTFGNGLYHLFMVILGMAYYCFTNIMPFDNLP